MRLRVFVILAAVLVAISAGAAWWALARSNGFSARSQPGAVERLLSRAARRWAIPSDAKSARSPIQFSQQVWAESRAHFADHCASCHANDGSGDTELGRNLYPKAPDMRLADTQRLSDGELYWIIENGIRLTGMPAWGTGRRDDEDTWKLVVFIRRLKDLTPEQLEEMKSMNPKTPAEFKEEEEDRQFLEGKDAKPAPESAVHHH